MDDLKENYQSNDGIMFKVRLFQEKKGKLAEYPAYSTGINVKIHN